MDRGGGSIGDGWTLLEFITINQYLLEKFGG